MLPTQKIKQLLLALICIFFLAHDFSYSFQQYYHTPLDGDITTGIIVSPGLQKTLHDPFGFNAIWKGEKAPNPNRYFSHRFFVDYFTHVPLWFQRVTTPVNSIYAACAGIKLLIHILFVYLLAAFISGSGSLLKVKVLATMAVLTVFFQAYGYYHYMGIIDKATTYNFFYALPLLLLLFFLFQFYTLIGLGKPVHFSRTKKVLLLITLLILPFSGPLIPGIFLVTSSLLFIYYFKRQIELEFYGSFFNQLKLTWQSIPAVVRFFFSVGALLSLYSLFLGTYNSVYANLEITLAEQYLKLPLGIYNQFTQKLGYPLLLLMLAINMVLIRKYYYNARGKQLYNHLKWIGLFALVYILLLPLGGYRPYRPNTLRYDTIMPITMALIFLFGTTSHFLIGQIKLRKHLYYTPLLALLFVFNQADRSPLNESDCEKASLVELASTGSDPVCLSPQCTVLSWSLHPTKKRLKENVRLLHFWNVVPEDKRYCVAAH